MTRIKLCGMTREADIDVINELLPDLMGFVFYEKSKRYVVPKQAEILKRDLDPRVKAVGVFVNEDVEVVADLLDRGIIDMAQLHGSEDADYIRNLRARTDKPIIKAFRMNSLTDLSRIAECEADEVLLDSGAGTGAAFDWERIPDMGRPFYLAGGLYPHTIDEALQIVHPYGVDVSSGIETDGCKDPKKMADFVAAVRQFDAQAKSTITCAENRIDGTLQSNK